MASKSKTTAPMDHGYNGSWKVTKVEVINDSDTGGIEGAIFHLSDTGDIFWKLHDDAGPTPFFAANFDLYEVVGSKFPVIKFIGSRSGDKIDFNVSKKTPELIKLKYTNSFTFHCERVSRIERAIEAPFSLYSAYRESFFSDLTIKADNGREFAVHKTILKAACPQMAWDGTPPPLSGTPGDVLHTLLHFLYTECLPEEINEETARKVLAVSGKLPGFSRLANLCQLYLHNIQVKNQFVSLVNDLHACGDRLAEIFSNKKRMAEGSVRTENFMAEPAKLVYAFKQGVREGAVAGVKFLLICDLFSKRKGEMSKHERHEVMKYVKSRLPIFVKQLYKFFENFREQLTKDITQNQRQDLSLYLVPEMDKCLDLTTDVVEDSKTAIETVLKAVNARGEKKKPSTMDYLNKMVKNAMHLKELYELKNAHVKIGELFQSMMWRQEAFSCLSDEDKAYSVSTNIEQLIDEFPVILEKIQKLDLKVNDGFSMKNWKFLFKMGTSRVTWSLEKVVTHRESFRPIIERVDKMIGRDDFHSGLVQVGLLAPSPNDRTDMGAESMGGVETPREAGSEAEGGLSSSSLASSLLPREGESSGFSHLVPPFSGKQPNVVESLCVPPSASDSRLAKALGELFESGVNTDMCFEVITITEEPSDIVVDHTKGHPVETQSQETMESRHLVRAHCAVIAARCDWFRRALLSGMRESIDKKIEVHDTDPELFHQFLVFIYSGQINTSEMSTEHIVDMLSLGDRYEVDTLKHVCEAALKSRIDEDSVLFLLSLADQYHTANLREAAMNYIKAHPFVVGSEVYEELPEHLQQDVKKLIDWSKNDQGMDPVSRYQGKQYDSGSDSDSTSDEGMDTSAERHGLKKPLPFVPDSDSSSEGDLGVGDQQRMQDCVAKLIEVLGEELPLEDMQKLVQAADFDVNRAINHYYSTV